MPIKTAYVSVLVDGEIIAQVPIPKDQPCMQDWNTTIQDLDSLLADLGILDEKTEIAVTYPQEDVCCQS